MASWKLLSSKCNFNVLIIAVFCVICVNSEPVCSPGVNLLGYTYPHGDIQVEYGKPLKILCVVTEHDYLQSHPNTNYTELYFLKGGQPVDESKVKMINSTCIELYDDKPEKHQSMYVCKSKSIETAVCLNHVEVGVKPSAVDNFRCISQNYDNLTCTWTPNETIVKTNFKLTNVFGGKYGRPYDCPQLQEGNDMKSCFWSINTTPQYRQVQPNYYFTLTMTNLFGSYNMSYDFKHYEYVIPGPPENLTAQNTTASSILLQWTLPSSMQGFKKGLQHRVLYQCEYGPKHFQYGGDVTTAQHDGSVVHFKVAPLPFAHALCVVRVAMRSAVAAVDDETLWSRNSSITVRTSSKVPDEPPRTNIGSFEIVSGHDDIMYNEVYIYWQQINESHKNGEDFQYMVDVVSEDGRDGSLEPSKPCEFIEKTTTYAHFRHVDIRRTHHFSVTTRNVVGESLAPPSVVTVPAQRVRPLEPQSFTKIAYGHNSYELIWETRNSSTGTGVDADATSLQYDSAVDPLVGYTLYWCSHDRDRPYQCTGYLDWIDVGLHVHSHNITISAGSQVTQFAITANTARYSSGMVWASCTVLFNKSIGKMKDVWINNVGPTNIEVGWKLDCSDRIGSVEGFIIYYCPLMSPRQTQCKGPQRSVRIDGDSTLIRGNITGLTPYTTYMLRVAVESKHNKTSQTSDPLYNTTLETAPSSPLNLRSTNVSKSSITLSWSIPSATNGVLKYYLVRFNNHSVKAEVVQPDATNVVFELKDLQSYVTYNISVSACTIYCSEPSHQVLVTTKMGEPGLIRQPKVDFQNNSFVTVNWDKPSEPNGRIDLYEVQLTYKMKYLNETLPPFNVTEATYSIISCGGDGDGNNNKYNTFYIAVRAVNIIDEVMYAGPWSRELESYCQTPASTIMFWLAVMVGTASCVLAVYYLSSKCYSRYRDMRDIEVKLPAGLAPVIGEGGLSWGLDCDGKNAGIGTIGSVSAVATTVVGSGTLGKLDSLSIHHHHHHLLVPLAVAGGGNGERRYDDEQLVLLTMDDGARGEQLGDGGRDSLVASLETNSTMGTLTSSCSSSSSTGSTCSTASGTCIGIDNEPTDHSSLRHRNVTTPTMSPSKPSNLGYVTIPTGGGGPWTSVVSAPVATIAPAVTVATASPTNYCMLGAPPIMTAPTATVVPNSYCMLGVNLPPGVMAPTAAPDNYSSGYVLAPPLVTPSTKTQVNDSVRMQSLPPYVSN